ncbi:MAG: hypothetical protein ACI4TK_04640 [Agathobacter sp.]
MDKKIIKERLEEAKKQIKDNSKDVHLADKLISDLILNQKQLDVVPLNTFDIGKELKRKQGETFYATINENGAMLHVYNNIEYLIHPNNKALFGLIENFVNEYEGDGSDEDKDIYSAIYSCIPYIFCIPTWSALDINLMLEFATKMLNYIRKKSDEFINEDMQDETRKENAQFEQVSELMDSVAKELDIE